MGGFHVTGRQAGGMCDMELISPSTALTGLSQLEVAAHLLQKFSANPWCAKCCFLWQTKQKGLAPELLLLKSTDYESHRVGLFSNPSHPSNHSSTLIQTEWIIPTVINEQWTSGNPLPEESAILGQSFVVFDKITLSTFYYEGKCRLGISFGKLLVLMWYCFQNSCSYFWTDESAKVQRQCSTSALSCLLAPRYKFYDNSRGGWYDNSFQTWRSCCQGKRNSLSPAFKTQWLK